MKEAKKMRNYVAKYMQRSGAGTHKAKQGKYASRARNKQNYQRNQGNDNV
jgi:hypothetical protein